MPEWFYWAMGAAVTSLGGVQVARGLVGWARGLNSAEWITAVGLGLSFILTGGAIVQRAVVAITIFSLITAAIVAVQIRSRHKNARTAGI